MSKPTPGEPYEVGEDTTMEEVSIGAYGTPDYASWIFGANATRPTNVVVVGETLIIPGPRPAVTLTGKRPDQMTFIVGDREIPLLAARIIRTMDTGTSGWSGRMVWAPGEDKELDQITRPYGYERAAAYIGDTLLVSGRLYITEPELTDAGLTKVLTGFSFTADMVDSNKQPPYEYADVTLDQLAAAFTPPIGIKSVVKADTGGKFALATGHESDTLFGYLSRLATERGLLVGDTPEGDLLIHRADTDGEPVGTLDETHPIATGWKAKYDGRKRFSVFKCINAAGTATAVPLWKDIGAAAPVEANPITESITDPEIPTSRFYSFRADDTTLANTKAAARWRRNKQYIESLTQPITVVDWYAPDGSLWRENTLVTVVSAVLGVPKGFTFLIRSVEFILEDKRTTVLQLVPPQGYTNQDIGKVWELE